MNNKYDEYDEYDVSDEYLADQMTSEQYAEAARQANQQSDKPVQADSEVRRFEYGAGSDKYQNNKDSAAGEKAFRRSVRPNGQELLMDTDSNQYNLEDLDVLDEETERSYNRRVRRTHQTDKRRPADNRKSFLKNKHVKSILDGFKQIFSLLFSKRPMQVFHLELHWGVFGFLALFNILLVAGLNSILYTKSIKALLTKMNLANLGGTGTIFGLSALSQLVTLILLFILLILMSFLLKTGKNA